MAFFTQAPPEPMRRLQRRLGKPAAVLFDWDDTLSHHRATSFKLMETIMLSHGRQSVPPVTGEKLLHDWYENTERTCRTYFPDHTAEDIRNEYRRLLSALPISEVTLLPQAKETLEALRDLDIPMAIVSNKSQERLEAELQALGVRDYFKTVVGHEPSRKGKPEPDPLVEAVKALQLKDGLRNLWMVGDAPEDAQAARSDGIQRFHIGEFLADVVHTRVEPNDPLGGVVFLKDLAEFKTKYVDRINRGMEMRG